MTTLPTVFMAPKFAHEGVKLKGLLHSDAKSLTLSSRFSATQRFNSDALDDTVVVLSCSASGCACICVCLVAAAFLGQYGRVAASLISFHCEGGQPGAKSFQRVVPKCIARERIETEDFTGTGGQNSVVLQTDIHEIEAFEMCRPNLLAGGAIQRHNRSSDADKN